MANATDSGGVDLLTLEAVLGYCKNWFSRSDWMYFGEFTIAGGVLSGVSEYLRDGQYFRILGSVFNDGLHQWGREDDSLTDEAFTGAIWALAIPPAVLALAAEIEAWQTKYGAAANSPFNSESFSEYSYTKASGVTQDGGTGGWEAVFRAKLNRWRKL